MEITKKIYLISGTLLFTGIIFDIVGFLLLAFVIGVPFLVIGILLTVIGAIGVLLLIPAIGFETAKALTKTIIQNRAKIAYGLFHKPTREETKEARAKLRNMFLRKEVKNV
ncbi:hypothetical protein KBC14_01670 [Candidatus Woesebacteria bacterium]|nr:hypothetical protein [Candidatus Woesebacteria bacterium]MBP6883080.1 hypothetical protein [Candidatus Woesebacteria bacterium]